jgi:hypothetical protein
LEVFTAAHPRLKDSVDAAGLAAVLRQKITRQLDALWPTDPASLERFRQLMSPALSQTLAVTWPGPGQIEAKGMGAAEVGSPGKITVHRRDLPGAIELLCSVPAGSDGRKTLAEMPQVALIVASAAGDVEPVLQGLRQGGSRVFVLRPKPHPKETISAGTAEQRINFVSTYYRTALAWQVQDVLTALAYTSGRARASGVRLVGLGDAGIPTLLARAIAQTDKVRVTIADVAGLDDRDEAAWTGPRAQAGILRLGGLRTAAILASPGRLVLYNTSARFDAAVIRAAYRAAGHESALEISGPPWSVDRIVK